VVIIVNDPPVFTVTIAVAVVEPPVLVAVNV